MTSARGFLGVSAVLCCAAATAGAQSSFTFMQSGFTQSLYANAAAFFGGSAFAHNGDLFTNVCAFAGSPLFRFAAGTAAPDGHGGLEHPQVAGSPFPSNAGCGMTNHPDGTLYSNTSLGITNLDINS